MNKTKLKEIFEELKNYPQNPRLLAVTKYSQIDDIKEALDNGVFIVGENRLKHARDIFLELDCSNIEKHFIGTLQTKKIRNIVSLFDVIESVSQIKHLEKIDFISGELDRSVKVFLQFNISNEFQKSGFLEKNIDEIIKTSKKLKNIEITGIMGMGSNTDLEQNREEFKYAKSIFYEIKKEIITIKELSLGMSNDYKVALEEGSTLIRIGSLIFK